MRRLPPLNTLRAFEAAARHLSFKQAAAELAVTPTAISHQIRLLEEICGQALFRRRPRPISLTPAGARLYPVLRDGFDAFAAALREIDANTVESPLRISTTSAFASRLLVPRLADWRRQHPEIELDLHSSEAVVDLHGGAADLALRYAAGPCPGLIWRELFQDGFLPMASPGLLESHGPLRRPSDLLRFPLLHYKWLRRAPEEPSWEKWIALARRQDPEVSMLDPNAGLRFSAEANAIEAAVGGQGVALLSQVLLSRELEDGRLVAPLDIALPGLRYFAVHLPQAPRLAAIDAFIAWLKD